MSTFLGNLATRAIGESSLNSSRLLRPIVPSTFASSAVKANVGRAMDFPQDGMRAEAKAQPTETAGRGFSPAQIAAGVEGIEGQTEDRMSDAVRARSAGDEERFDRPGIRLDPAFVAVGPSGKPLLSEPKINVDLNFRNHSSTNSRINGSDNDRSVLPQRAAKPLAVLEREDEAWRTVSNTFPDKLDRPPHTSDSAKVGAAAASSAPLVGRDISSPAPAGPQYPSGAAMHTSPDLSKSPVFSQSLPNLRYAGGERKVAASSTAAGSLVSAAGAHGEALQEHSPMRATSDPAIVGSATGSASAVSANFAGLRDRSTSAAIAQNRLSLTGALRSIAGAQQPAHSASQNIVEVHIGRIEVRAPWQPSSKAAARESGKTPSLDDYLRGRTGRGRP